MSKPLDNSHVHPCLQPALTVKMVVEIGDRSYTYVQCSSLVNHEVWGPVQVLEWEKHARERSDSVPAAAFSDVL